VRGDDAAVAAPAHTARVPRQRRPAPAADRATSDPAQRIVEDLVAQPWGDISASVYETGRLVTLAPWLTAHAARVRFLRDSQRPDGGWGGPEGYALVPTLSATEALLTTLRRAERGGAGELSVAVDRGLRALFSLLPAVGEHNLPDTPAVEIIAPALVAQLNEHLGSLLDAPITGLDAWRGGHLPLPGGMDHALTDAIRAKLRLGAALPAKLLHFLEVAGADAVRAPGVRPLPLGMIGASPAATAAWLGEPAAVETRHRAARYLEAVAERDGGPVPTFVPITAFERSWVLSGFASVGFIGDDQRSSGVLDIPDELVASMRATLGPDGAASGPGLPPDADTTAATLHALARLGAPHSMDCLRRYETETHFFTWLGGERTSSATTNAHVLEALTDVLTQPGASAWHQAAADKISAWLCDQQLADGTWQDKWHASPYYATTCCVVALAGLPVNAPTRANRIATCLETSVRWVLDTQRSDGAWGRWDATAEETAYAIQILLLSGATTASVERAVARAYAYLRDAARGADPVPAPPLWHDKDLYVPRTIVRAATLGALRLARASPGVVALLPPAARTPGA
jgi:hypothetical protein